MKKISGLIFLQIVCMNFGCNQIYYGARNTINEPIQLFNNLELTHQTKKYAKHAWKDFAKEHPEWASSQGFHDGFIDGYAGFLDRGGTGEPPAVPPPKYRRNRYLNPAGYEAIEQYFSGYTVGAQMGKASGIRETLVVPVLIPAKADNKGITNTGSKTENNVTESPEDIPNQSLPTPKKLDKNLTKESDKGNKGDKEP